MFKKAPKGKLGKGGFLKSIISVVVTIGLAIIGKKYDIDLSQVDIPTIIGAAGVVGGGVAAYETLTGEKEEKK